MEIWLDDEALSDHFDNVRNRLKRGNDDDGWEDIPQQNDITRELRRG